MKQKTKKDIEPKIKDILLNLKSKYGYIPAFYYDEYVTKLLKRQIITYIVRFYGTYKNCIIELFGEQEYKLKKDTEKQNFKKTKPI